MSHDSAADSAIEILRRQELALVLPQFDEDVAMALGTALHARAAAQKAPVVIEIRGPDRRFYFAALSGSTPENDNWARRKANSVLYRHTSSLLAGAILAKEGRSQWPDAVMQMEDYSVHGGAFPVRVKGSGVVAVIAVSGLPSREDHDLIVSVLRDYLGANNVPPTP